MISRFKLFIGHYKLLREKRTEESPRQTLLSQLPLGACNVYATTSYHPSYSMWNCAIWAWSNSKTHKLDGTYL